MTEAKPNRSGRGCDHPSSSHSLLERLTSSEPTGPPLDAVVSPGRIFNRFGSHSRTRGKTPGTSKPLIELIFSNITTSPTRGCEEVLHRIAQRPIAIYSGAKVINPNIFLRLLLNFQLAIRNRQTISIRGAE